MREDRPVRFAAILLVAAGTPSAQVQNAADAAAGVGQSATLN